MLSLSIETSSFVFVVTHNKDHNILTNVVFASSNVTESHLVFSAIASSSSALSLALIISIHSAVVDNLSLNHS
jgi:hypothetical protein